MKTTLVLMVAVTYDHPRRQDLAYGKEQLENLVQHAAGNGLLSGDSREEVAVDSWTHKVFEGDRLILPATLKPELVKLLSYSQEAEEKHYEECKADEGATSMVCKNHIWHSVRKLAWALGLKF